MHEPHAAGPQLGGQPPHPQRRPRARQLADAERLGRDPEPRQVVEVLALQAQAANHRRPARAVERGQVQHGLPLLAPEEEPVLEDEHGDGCAHAAFPLRAGGAAAASAPCPSRARRPAMWMAATATAKAT